MGFKVGTFWQGFLFAFLFLGILSVVFAVGYHTANEILGGTFKGNFSFEGNMNFSNATLIGEFGSGIEIDKDNLCDLTREGQIKYNSSKNRFYGCDGNNWREISLGDIEVYTSPDEYNVLLLHCEVAVDTSIVGNTLNQVGSPQLSSTYSKFGEKSCYFDGSSYYSIPYSSSWDFGTEDFTIDFWTYPTGGSSNRVWIDYNTYSGWTNFYDGTRVYFYSNLGTIYVDFTIVNNQWQHIAVVRSGSTFTIYVNGVSKGSWTNAGSLTAQGTILKVGSGAYGGYTGYMDEIRISKGIARWTDDFTPSTEAYS